MTDIQYISDAQGNPVGVFVPIEIWNEIEAKKEISTESETIKRRGEESKFWLGASEDSLNEIWNNEEDDVYAELLEK